MKLSKFSFLPTLFVYIFFGCADERDAYYDTPDWVKPPIYDVLKSKNKFTMYLECVDRTLYSVPLKSSGLYTVFAPNDDAFRLYLTENNFSSIAEIPDSTVNKIIGYSIVYNKFVFDRLSDVLNAGWDTASCIKKRTAYYESLHNETYKGKSIWVLDKSTFSVGDNNYKYVPLYLSRVFERYKSRSQAEEDFSILYTTNYSGQNIQNANILQKDMLAQNGVAFEIDRVLEPLPNIENLLNSPDYSMFKELLNAKGSTRENYFINYTISKTAGDYYKQALPDKNIDEVYLKKYIGLAFSPNAERYETTTQIEKDGFTLFAPSNQAVLNFYNDKLKDYFPNGIATLSNEALSYFINAQMISTIVFPNDYKNSINSQGEFLNGKGVAGSAFDKNNYKKIAPASNGVFYGSDQYIKSRFFETVYTEILFNTSYSLLRNAFQKYFLGTLDEELMKCELNGYTQENYTILLPSDELFKNDGFAWSWLSNSSEYGFTHLNSSSSLGNFDVAARMQRLVKSHIFRRIKNSEVNCALTEFKTDATFESAYGGYSYAVNEFGDMIRYKDGKIQMIGNADDNQWVTATPYKTFMNGQVFKIDKLLQYSPRNTYPTSAQGYKSNDLWTYILNMSTSIQNVNVALFKNYMNACLKGDASNELAGLSVDANYTIFMPTNAAINRAIANGDLPTLTNVTADVSARQKATAFILYHIVKGKIFVDDGLPCIMPNKERITEEVWPTAYKDVVNNTYLAIRKDGNRNLIVSTQVLATGKNLSQTVKTTSVTRGVKRSNYFGPKAVLHEISDYLIYKKP